MAYPDKHDQAYMPTWDFGGASLGDEHMSIVEAVADIDGLLYDEDALKLFELAYFTPGPILEIGVYRGKSTTVMARALRAARNPGRVVSIDVDPIGLRTAASNLTRHRVAGRVTLVEGTSGAFLTMTPAFRPGLVFVDGDHTYNGVRRDLEAIEPITPIGSIVVMHDFEGYAEDDPYWIQVESATRSSWLEDEGEFIGRFGLCGVFVRTSGGPDPCTPGEESALTVEVERARKPSVRLRRRASRAVDYRLHALRSRLGR